MSGWIKVAALFMLAFLLFDVCSPERCDAVELMAARSTAQVQAQHQDGGGDGCQFEEDCFQCAHYAPGVTFQLQPIATVAFTEPSLFLPSLDGTPRIPFHPPRA